MPSWGLSKYIETKLQITCFYLILSFFKKRKGVWNLSLCLIICIIFREKYFSSYTLLIAQVSLPGSFTSWDIGLYVYYHSHKKQHSLETCPRLLFMLLQDVFASARLHRVHKNCCYQKMCCTLFVPPKIKKYYRSK